MRRRGHTVDEFWADDLGRLIRHGNLHYLLELPWKYRSAVRRRVRTRAYDVIELNQPHAYAAAADHQRSQRPGVFVNRSHGHEVRVEQALEPWQRLMPPRGAGRRMLSRVMRRLLDRQWDLISGTADGFVVSCTEDREFLAERYRVDADCIGTIPQGVPDAFLTRKPQDLGNERSRRLLYVGQMAFIKAPAILGQAVSQILKRVPDATMTWVCSRSHHGQALELVDPEVRDRVTVLDWMSQEQLIDVFDGHGVFLFPSFFEGFGKAPLEAMSRGLCVIASRTGGMRDYIQDGINGMLVPIGDADQIAQTALRLLAQPERMRRISDAARTLGLQYSWDRCARDLEAFYERLLARKRASGHG
jgi:glycosyltransferase involved in cell wall biosynthesis